MFMKANRALAIAAFVAMAGCGAVGSSMTNLDSGVTHTQRSDSGQPDEPVIDAGGEALDSGTWVGTSDAGGQTDDAGHADGGTDAGFVDAGAALDAGSDAGLVDAGKPDAGKPDAGTVPLVPDSGAPELFAEDAGPWTFQVPVTDVTPFVEISGETITLSAPRIHTWGREWSVFAQSTGPARLVATFQLFSVAERLTAKLISSVDETYRFGVAFSGTQARVLDVDLTPVPLGKSTWFYPYDWTKPSPPGGSGAQCTSVAGLNGIDIDNFVEPGLVIPGVKLDTDIFSHAEVGLTSLAIDRTSVGVTVKFYAQREFNRDGHDQSTTSHRLRPGVSRAVQVLGAASVRDVERDKFGTPKAFSGTLTQMPVQGWGSESPSAYLSIPEYEQAAATLADGGVDHVIMRLNRPRADIAAAISAQGVKPHFYQFLGVARSRVVGGVSCYSLVIRGQTQCVSDDWLARDSSQRPLVPTNCSWAYLDLRRVDVRAALTDIAQEAIENGYVGIFFDGTIQAPAGDGYVGGESSGSSMSLFSARVQLLQEVKTAITQVNPNAVVGTLSNAGLGYTEFQTIGHYVIEEFATWVTYPADPSQRTVSYPAGSFDAIASRAKFVTSSLYLGAKGVDPAQVQQAHATLRAKTTLPFHPYVEVGDFNSQYIDEWAAAMRDVAASFP